MIFCRFNLVSTYTLLYILRNTPCTGWTHLCFRFFRDDSDDDFMGRGFLPLSVSICMYNDNVVTVCHTIMQCEVFCRVIQYKIAFTYMCI